MATQLTDPFRGFRFRVEIAGIQIASFSEASVPDISVDTVDYREGTDPIYKRPLSGLTNYGRLNLKKGLTTTLDLYNWQQQVSQLGSGSPGARKNISLVLMDTAGAEGARWNIINAWPVKYDTTGLNASSTEVLVETLELAMDYMNRIK
jgi:phage tail-like protein